jgi:3-dehydroquinate synthase II
VSELTKGVWIRADWDEPWESRKSFVTAALEAGAGAIAVLPEEAAKAHELGVLDVVADEPAEGVDIVMLSARSVDEVERAIDSSQKLREQGYKTAICVEISDKETERAAVRAGKATDFLVTIARDWKVIPLENLIAELQSSEAKILAGVKEADEARTAVETLEVGADGVLLDPRERGVEEIKKVCETLESLATEKLELVPVKVTTVKPAGMGDRACIDTTSLMKVGEGMLVGSQANGLFLVHSETLASEYVEARPFRVNAGAVHAYVQAPGGKTKYLSELQAGDDVLIVNAQGETRAGVIGRVKIERRPMLLVEAELEGQKVKTLVQNAETINLVEKDGKPISVSELKPGDVVLAHVERGGRHFGVKVEETLVER